MPISKSAKKSLRVSKVKRAQNRKQEIDLEKALKKASANTVNAVISKIDKAAKTRLISQNKAARMKSRLTKKFGTPKNVKAKVASTTKKQATKTETKAKAKPKKTTKK